MSAHRTTAPAVARRTHGFTESVIREMTRLAHEHDALNLAQGFPDFATPDVVKEAAVAAIRADINQYAVTWGAPRLRRAVAGKYARCYGMEVDEATEVTITCGATEAMIAATLALLDPGDEVVIPEPFYENYAPDAILSGAVPVWLRLGPAGELDPDRLAAVVTRRTRAIILNTPNNPTGRVLTRAELEGVADVCRRHGLVALTDETYEHIVFDGAHTPLATLPGMRERTVTISSYSKTFAVTGWRIGTVVAPPRLTDAIRKVHDFLTVGAPAPLQEACAVALDSLGDDYYADLARAYRERRDFFLPALRTAGFRCATPAGAYYVLADFSALSAADDVSFARALARGTGPGTGVAVVPGSSFFHDPADGRKLVRFSFCKRMETLEEAARRLEALAPVLGRDGETAR